jgi:hypothetical protein
VNYVFFKHYQYIIYYTRIIYSMDYLIYCYFSDAIKSFIMFKRWLQLMKKIGDTVNFVLKNYIICVAIYV